MQTEKVIICRSLRHLDALVAEKVMGKVWSEGLGPKYDLPHYTTWAGVEAVVQVMEGEGFWVSMEGASGLGMTPDAPDAAFHKNGDTRESGYATGPTLPIAVCLAALSAKGVEVSFEQG